MVKAPARMIKEKVRIRDMDPGSFVFTYDSNLSLDMERTAYVFLEGTIHYGKTGFYGDMALCRDHAGKFHAFIFGDAKLDQVSSLPDPSGYALLESLTVVSRLRYILLLSSELRRRIREEEPVSAVMDS